MADFTYDPGLVLNADTGAPVPNATGELRATPGGAAVPVFDLLGNPIAALTSNALGVCQRFSANIARGYISFGSVIQSVASDQVQDSLTQATAAATAATSASTSALASRTAAESALAATSSAATAATAAQLAAEAAQAAAEDAAASGGITAETLVTAPAGSVFIVDYWANDPISGPANSMPNARPSNRGDITFIWKVPTDPGPSRVNPTRDLVFLVGA